MFSEALCVCITMRGSIHNLLFPLCEKLYVLCNLVKEYVHILVRAVVQTKKEHIGYIKPRVIFCTIVTNSSCSVFSLCEPLLFFFVTRYPKVNLFEIYSHRHTHLHQAAPTVSHFISCECKYVVRGSTAEPRSLKRCFLPVQHMEVVSKTEA